jgi:protein-S-isoprenylcysteine O-methyltransferase Ste14
MLKATSIVGYLGMAGGLIAQFVTGNLFSSSPVVIAIQVGAGLLLVWARLAFGRRSFHLAANPTEGGLVTDGPYRYIRHPIYAAVACSAGWRSSALVLGERVPVRDGAELRVPANPL